MSLGYATKPLPDHHILNSEISFRAPACLGRLGVDTVGSRCPVAGQDSQPPPSDIVQDKIPKERLVRNGKPLSGVEGIINDRCWMLSNTPNEQGVGLVWALDSDVFVVSTPCCPGKVFFLAA